MALTLSEDPRVLGAYSFPEAGRLLESSPATLRSWTFRGVTALSDKHPLQPRLLSFHDLISLLVVRELRNRVRLEAICTAYRYMVSELGLHRPFAQQRFWTSGRDVFVKLLLDGLQLPVAASKYGQISFAAILEQSLQGVEYGPDLLASVWRPVPQVWVNPRIRRGSPCLNGTRIDTWVLYDLHVAGESADYLARLYQQPVEQVQTALEWEARLRTRAA